MGFLEGRRRDWYAFLEKCSVLGNLVDSDFGWIGECMTQASGATFYEEVFLLLYCRYRVC